MRGCEFVEKLSNPAESSKMAKQLEAEGIEPPTFCMQSRHSTTELRPRDEMKQTYKSQCHILDHILLEFTIAFF